MADFTDKLHVVTVVFNPRRYASRYKLYNRFAQDCKDAGARLWTVEIAFGERPHEVTSSHNPHHIQLRTRTELWLKECAINLAVQRLPDDANYVAWVDADVKFARPDWANETVHMLQHYSIVQMFSSAFDLDPKFNPFQHHRGFCYQYHQDQLTVSMEQDAISYGGYCDKPFHSQNVFWHPGFAWAARRQTLEDIGGLLDWPILGSADHHFAGCLIGKVSATVPHTKLESYVRGLYEYQERVELYVKRNIGFVDGSIQHYWHGKKKDRHYQDRWTILINNNFDPLKHLKRDAQGLFQFDHRAPISLRDQVRHYFSIRNEDSIDLDPTEVRL